MLVDADGDPVGITPRCRRGPRIARRIGSARTTTIAPSSNSMIGNEMNGVKVGRPETVSR